MMAVGVARPRAHGQAMMRTETKLSRAKVRLGRGPKIIQTANVRTAMPMTAGTK
jgi:hypothetical protein